MKEYKVEVIYQAIYFAEVEAESEEEAIEIAEEQARNADLHDFDYQYEVSEIIND